MPQDGPKKSVSLRAFVAALGMASALAWQSSAMAQTDPDRYSSIVLDARTGVVLQATDADAPRHPASLAKLMTLYLTFEALRDHRITLDELVPVSEHAASMEPTKLGLQPGMSITVEQAVLGLVTRSANDAAAALGEMLGGSEDRFAELMTLKAHALGMSRSHFANASGLPAPGQWTSARDMGLLARRLIADFPGFYHYFSTPSFVFHGQVVLNHDTMLKDYPGVDGMKTGYTVASGHNLVTSAVRDGHRLIGVELGAASNAKRDVAMTQLLNTGFEQEGVAPAAMLVAFHPRGRFAGLGRSLGLISTARADERGHHIRLIRPIRHESAHESGHESGKKRSRWGVQVGSFRSRKAAKAAAAHAHTQLDDGSVKVERVMVRGRSTWRARVVGLSPAQAHGTCAKRDKHHKACIVLHA